MDANQLLQTKSQKVKNLMRHYRVAGGADMATVEKGYKKHGERFMMKLLEILVPDENSFSYLTATIPSIQPTAIATSLDTKTLATSANLDKAIADTDSKGGFWGFWDKLLNTVAKTGQTVEDLKTNLAADPSINISTEEQAAASKSRTTLYLVGAVILVAVIVALFIFRKK